MEIKAYKCDVCGREKQIANHWFRVRIGEAFHIYRWDFFGEGGDDTSIDHKHVCGQQCLLKIQQQFLDRSATIQSNTTEVKTNERTKDDRTDHAPCYPDNSCDPLADARLR